MQLQRCIHYMRLKTIQFYTGKKICELLIKTLPVIRLRLIYNDMLLNIFILKHIISYFYNHIVPVIGIHEEEDKLIDLELKRILNFVKIGLTNEQLELLKNEINCYVSDFESIFSYIEELQI